MEIQNKISLEKKEHNSFEKKYSEIMSVSENSIVLNIEWTKKGDFFQKLSLYDHKSPVKASINTTLVTNI